jgi:hypothetical protein
MWPKERPERTGDGESAEAVAGDLFQAEARVLDPAVAAAAEEDAGYFVEQAAEGEGGEHAVDAVRLCVRGVGLVGGTHQGGDHGQVAADEGAGGGAFGQFQDAVGSVDEFCLVSSMAWGEGGRVGGHDHGIFSRVQGSNVDLPRGTMAEHDSRQHPGNDSRERAAIAGAERTRDNYMSVKELLESLFPRKIDLVMKGALKPRLRDRILREAIRAA